MAKILVTGLSGFTGAYIKKELESRGHSVLGLSQDCKDGDDDLSCDITNYDSLYNALRDVHIDGVIHLAALSFVGHKNPLDFYAVNTLGTENLLRALAETQKDLQKVILASSANVYGQRGGDVAISEEECVQPVNHYAISKIAMEYVAATFYDVLPIVIVRPFNYTGAGQDEKFLIPKIVSHYKQKKEIIELGNIDVARDFSDVRDVAAVYGELFGSDVRSEIFNLCSGEVHSVEDVIRYMNEISGHEMKVVVNPDFVRGNEIKTLKGSREKLERIIKIKPNFSFKETLINMYNANF